jgi:hypothetical protein
MKGRCIYCSRYVELSGEHYLPGCLGKFRGYELLNDRICKDCNNSFSPLDEQFCRSGPEAIIRDMLGVEGRKSHKKVSPFQRGSVGAERLTFKGRAAGDDATAEEIELDVDRKGRAVRRLRQIIFSTGERCVAIRITDDMREPGQLLGKMKERGVEMATPADNDTEITTAEIIGVAPDELEWIHLLLSGVRENMLGEPKLKMNEPGQLKVTMHASPTEKCFRGLAKIGFHYFLKHMRGFHGSENTFTGIRDFIMDGQAEDVDRFVSGRTNHITADIIPGESPAGYFHLLSARADYERLLCKMQFFIQPKYSSALYRLDRFILPVYTIHLGRNPSRIVYPRASRHYFTYSDEYKREGYNGEMREEPLCPR